MRDATYVLIALALCMLALLFVTEQKPRGMYMLDLEDFRQLPTELRNALRRMLPDQATIRQRWSVMTPDQKRNAIQQLGGFIPQPKPVQKYVPEPLVIDERKDKDPEDEKENEVVALGTVVATVDPPATNADGGFLGGDE